MIDQLQNVDSTSNGALGEILNWDEIVLAQGSDIDGQIHVSVPNIEVKIVVSGGFENVSHFGGCREMVSS